MPLGHLSLTSSARSRFNGGKLITFLTMSWQRLWCGLCVQGLSIAGLLTAAQAMPKQGKGGQVPEFTNPVFRTISAQEDTPRKGSGTSRRIRGSKSPQEPSSSSNANHNQQPLIQCKRLPQLCRAPYRVIPSSWWWWMLWTWWAVRFFLPKKLPN
jgi:hypothetical protein